MKKIIFALGILALSLSAFADDKYGYQKPDWYDKDKVNTYDRYGTKRGYLKRDWIDKDKLNSYDSRGRLLGHQKQDWIDKDKYNLFRRRP